MDKLQWVEVAFRKSERWFRVIFNQTFGFIGLIEPIRILMETFKFGGITSSKVIRRSLSRACWSGLIFHEIWNPSLPSLKGEALSFCPTVGKLTQGVGFVDVST
ncbi:MAG: hypothetical protein V7K68_24165 [Nostoc sp.]|uniref:hypothetical protein n=1 Tax=Nostoc sp. TaxID=1180 RepID=UPI002FF7466B